MRFTSLLFFSIALSVLSLSAQTPPPSSPRVIDDAFGIAMEGAPYPFPVKFLSLDVEGQPVRLAYMDVRPAHANGDTVLLLHGKNFYGSYWENTIRTLGDAGYRVIVPDQIGFGKSSKPIINYTFDQLAANTALLLDRLAISQVAVVGHSMGGMLAVRFTLNHPEFVTHLVLENPIGLEDYASAIPPQTIETLRDAELTQTADDYRKFVSNYHATPSPAIVEPFVEMRDRLTRGAEFPRWAHVSALTYEMIYQQPVRGDFAKIARPTLLVIGQADRTAVGKIYATPDMRSLLGNYPALGKSAQADISGSELVELENVGHIPHLEAPDRFHSALLIFLKKK
ncbi:alpha/beta hydrolase [Nibricoccus aquaticus]|uniref:Alpha/beta hydrolase n=1 Tax=Nibricoccus aquaticus TaxID=2576891 RepID=A0A290Q303_9BACT|nr:alpha/beta hydrolase [Nibricoccus aquaticus]ATC63059.1 alpha/beta hydrolase [Nibricoccus aquaticus]